MAEHTRFAVSNIREWRSFSMCLVIVGGLVIAGGLVSGCSVDGSADGSIDGSVDNNSNASDAGSTSATHTGAGTSRTSESSVRDLSGGVFGVCFETGRLPDRVLTDAECACVVSKDNRPFSPGKDLSNAPLPNPDPRLHDPVYSKWTKIVTSTHCGCCHNRQYKGSGTAYWDLGHTPLWWDSFMDHRLRKIADPNDSVGQTLPLEATQLTAFAAFVEVEIERRKKARGD